MKRLVVFVLWMLVAPNVLLLFALAFGVIQHVGAPLYTGCFFLCGMLFLLITIWRDRSSRRYSFPFCSRCHCGDVPTRLYRYRKKHRRITATLCQDCASYVEGMPIEQ